MAEWATHAILNNQKTPPKAEELFPNLARKAQIYLLVVTNSVDTERSVSSYGHVFTEQRQSMKEDQVNKLTMLEFNSKV